MAEYGSETCIKVTEIVRRTRATGMRTSSTLRKRWKYHVDIEIG
jgi:hypothetical protein